MRDRSTTCPPKSHCVVIAVCIHRLLDRTFTHYTDIPTVHTDATFDFDWVSVSCNNPSAQSSVRSRSGYLTEHACPLTVSSVLRRHVGLRHSKIEEPRKIRNLLVLLWKRVSAALPPTNLPTFVDKSCGVLRCPLSKPHRRIVGDCLTSLPQPRSHIPREDSESSRP